MGNRIEPIFMPRWGLSMKNGVVLTWLVDEGEWIDSGQEIAEIETEKTVTTLEARASGILRKKIVAVGEQAAVRSLIGVVSASEVTEPELMSFIAKYSGKSRTYPTESVPDFPVPDKIKICGKDVNYLKLGESGERRILLLHGFGGDLNSWQFNHNELSSSATVYALDLPGHGGSNKDVGIGDYDALSTVIYNFVETVGLGEVHLVGHSLGGAVALFLSNRYPDLVASLTLISSVGLGTKLNEEYISNFIRARTSRELRTVLEQIFYVRKKLSQSMIEQVLKYKRIDSVNSNLEIIAKECLDSEARFLKQLSGQKEMRWPCQIIWGAEDQILQAPRSEWIPNEIKFNAIQGAGHMVHIEKAKEVNKLIVEFISKR